MKQRTASKAKPPAAAPPARPAADLWLNLFSLLLGGLFGLALLKFGNPVVMQQYFEAPQSAFEWLLNAWPVSWGYWLLFGVTLVGLISLRTRWRPGEPWILVALPLVWLFWQFVSAARSINPSLSWSTAGHFVSCAVCFYLGLFVLGKLPNPKLFWVGALAGFALVLVSGFGQRFGGLEETRRYFWLYIYPKEHAVPPPDLVKRMSSDRIFATLFYANTLAGVILLWLPMLAAGIWSWRRQFTEGARYFLIALVAVSALLCLFWSGSKSGWLLLLAVGFVGSLFLPFQRKLKLLLISGVLVIGLAGFFWKNAGYFQRGATSVEARFDYWQAALQIAGQHPVFGSGPGTFGQEYKKIKRPESEMAQITHNDYLEQACDSGLVGFLAFTGWIIGCLAYSCRRGRLGGGRTGPARGEARPSERPSERPNGESDTGWLRLAVWLGLLAWALQGTVEFGLYIPALAWPGFCLLGWLVAQSGNPIDSRESLR